MSPQKGSSNTLVGPAGLMLAANMFLYQILTKSRAEHTNKNATNDPAHITCKT
jgi:hypothetical protein